MATLMKDLLMLGGCIGLNMLAATKGYKAEISE